MNRDYKLKKNEIILEWDETKRHKVFQERRLDFADLEHFDWQQCISYVDTREDYGEERWVSIGHLKQELLVVVWTPTIDGRRIITCHKAKARVRRQHAEFEKSKSLGRSR